MGRTILGGVVRRDVVDALRQLLCCFLDLHTHTRIEGLGFRMLGLGIRVWNVGFRVQYLGLRV